LAQQVQGSGRRRLKTQPLGEFAREELTGKELLAGFRVQAKGVRDHLSRLILQEAPTPDEPVRTA
jgi:hypothetical protein